MGCNRRFVEALAMKQPETSFLQWSNEAFQSGGGPKMSESAPCSTQSPPPAAMACTSALESLGTAAKSKLSGDLPGQQPGLGAGQPSASAWAHRFTTLMQELSSSGRNTCRAPWRRTARSAPLSSPHPTRNNATHWR